MKLSYFVRNLPHRLRGWKEELAFRGLTPGIKVLSELKLCVNHADGSSDDLGVVGRRVVTTAGVNFIVDAFQNIVELELMKFHAFGTGVGAEAVGDTALGTEQATRATGTQTEASANQYVTVGTVTFSGTLAITEHGIFTLVTTSAGVLLDRTVFAAVNVISGDSITSTYTFTVTSGG